MTTPTVFPVWLQNPATGGPDTQVNDLGSYNAAIAMGYTYTSTATPSQTIATGETLEETPLNPTQVDTQDPQAVQP